MMTDSNKRFTDLKPLLAGLLTATAFGLAGFLLLRNENGSMGAVLFLFLPAAAGFAVALTTKPPMLITASLIIAVILCLAVLLVTGAEGGVCVLMALPVILIGLAIGGFCGYFFKRLVIDKSRMPQTIKLIALLITPFALMGANAAEKPSRDCVRSETFISSITIDSEPEEVWKAIKSVEHLDLPKPFLMKIGLPVPLRCELHREEVGGKRICYFDSGYIEETIVEWNFPLSMKMEITETRLPGRHWLSFKDCSYELNRRGDRTILIRKTTINSRLQPAWYWRSLEGLGVQTEHDYLFDYLREKLKFTR
jgi:hypothetical protein